jgi:hypothetical protein
MAYSAASHGSSGSTQRLNALKVGGETSAAHQPSASSQRCFTSASPLPASPGRRTSRLAWAEVSPSGVRRWTPVTSTRASGAIVSAPSAGAWLSTPYHRRSQRCSDPPNLASVLFCC